MISTLQRQPADRPDIVTATDLGTDRVPVMIRLEGTFCLDRARFDIPGISRVHFRLEPETEGWVLVPVSGTNPTLLNGQPQSVPVRLQDMDILQAASLKLLYFQGRLFGACPAGSVSALVPEAVLRPAMLLSHAEDGNRKVNQPALPEAVPLEAPSLPQPVRPPHWFSVLGPSLMIGVSSLASAGAMLLNRPDSLSGVLQMSGTSLTMAAAFLAYGLISRRITQKGARQDQAAQLARYEQYLAQQEEQLQQRIGQQRAELSALVKSLSGLELCWKGSQKQEKWCLPAAVQRISTPAFQLPSIRYDQKGQPGYQQLEALEDVRFWRESLLEISQGSLTYLGPAQEEQKESLLCLWSWMVWHPGRRFVRIGTPWKSSWLGQTAACVLDHTSLVFESLSAFRAFARQQPGVEWTVLSEQAPAEALRSEMPGCTWLVLTQAPGSLHRLLDVDPTVKKRSWLLQAFSAQTAAGKADRTGWPVRLSDPQAQADWFRSSQAVLQVVLGQNSQGEEIFWDLEKDGPHALIAGTTGSGKSEGLASVLLQLALHNSADQVQFFLIDFKGGALLSQFQNLPHFCGALTNLEQKDFIRLQKALDEELALRQRLLRDFAKEHPFASQDIQTYNAWNPQAPLAHLFLVADEFAQMKSRFPEAMAYMQEAARIGRSLGIHLILATQKPAGVIDEQIWSNARSRLCFPVHSASDSRQVLGHERAAGLKQPGEFILQVAGEETEKTGRALYARASVQKEYCFTECSEQGTPLPQKEPVSAAMRIQHLACQAEKSCQPLLVPFVSLTDTEYPAVTDGIRSLDPWKPQIQENLWIVTRKTDLEKMVLRFLQTDTLRLVQTDVLCSCRHVQTVAAESLWQLLDERIPARVLMPASQAVSCPLLEELMAADWISLCIVSEDMQPSWSRLAQKMDARLCIGAAERESLYLLFGSLTEHKESWPYGLLQKKQEVLPLCFTQSSDPAPAAVTHEKLDLLCNPVSVRDLSRLPACSFGFDAASGRPLFWNRRHPLAIVCASPKQGRHMEAMLEAWMAQDPVLSVGLLHEGRMISVLTLPQDQALLHDPHLQARLQSSSLLYLGRDFGEHQFVLKRRARQESGDAVYFEEEEVQLGFQLQLES